MFCNHFHQSADWLNTIIKFIITDNTGMCFHEFKHMLIRHVINAIRVQLFNVIRIEISLRQMMPDDSPKWHDNGFNERIAFIIIHWTNRADNESIAGILASKPITACQCQFTNVGFPGVLPDYDNDVLIEDGIPLFIIPDETLTRTALISMRISLMFMK